MGEVDSERQAVLETRQAVLETRLEALPRIEAKLDMFHEQYMTRTEVNDKVANVQREVDRLSEDAKTARKQWPVWVAVVIAAGSWVSQIWPHK